MWGGWGGGAVDIGKSLEKQSLNYSSLINVTIDEHVLAIGSQIDHLYHTIVPTDLDVLAQYLYNQDKCGRTLKPLDQIPLFLDKTKLGHILQVGISSTTIYTEEISSPPQVNFIIRFQWERFNSQVFFFGKNQVCRSPHGERERERG